LSFSKYVEVQEELMEMQKEIF